METQFANLDSQEVRIVDGEMRVFESGSQVGAGVPLSDGPFRISVRKVEGNSWLYYSDVSMQAGARYYTCFDPKRCGIDNENGYLKIQKVSVQEGPSDIYCIGGILTGNLDDIVRYGSPGQTAGLFHVANLYIRNDNNYYAEISWDETDPSNPFVMLACTDKIKNYIRIVLI